MSQNTEDSQVKDTLHKVSRIDFLKKKIVEQVRERGCFYRVKTFIDIITNPMLVSMENLLNQSLLNSTQGRIVLSKKRQFAVWKDGFKATGKNRIRSLLINLKSQLNGEIAAFAEEHFDDKNADKAWNRLLQEKGIQDNCQTLLTELEGLVRNNCWWWIIYFGDLCRRVWCGGCRPAWLDRAWGISGRSSWLFDIQK